MTGVASDCVTTVGWRCVREPHPPTVRCAEVPLLDPPPRPTPPRLLGSFDLHGISLIAHPVANGCVRLGPWDKTCPNCGAGYVSLVDVATAPPTPVDSPVDRPDRLALLFGLLLAACVLTVMVVLGIDP